VVERAGDELVDLLRAVPAIAADEHADLAAAWDRADVAVRG
jgi:hypothetical protein